MNWLVNECGQTDGNFGVIISHSDLLMGDVILYSKRRFTVMDLFLSEPHFMVLGHIYTDRGCAIPFKATSQGK